MNMQYLQNLAQSMGLDVQNLGQLSSFTPGDIASSLASTYGIDPSLMPEGLFTGITPGLLSGLYGKTYSPIIQAKQPSLIDSLSQSIGGQKGRQAHGGFGASGGWNKYQQGVKDVYGKGMTDVLSGVRQQQSQGIGAISDLINQWHQAAQSIKGI